MHILYIMSSKAGNGTPLAYTQYIQTLQQQSEHELHIHITTSQHDAAHTAEAFAQRYQDEALIYCLGGDGSCSEIINKLALSPACFGLLPCGSANDFARMLYGKTPSSATEKQAFITQLLNRSLNPTRGCIDLIKFTSDDKTHPNAWCFNALSFGLDACVIRSVYDFQRRYHLPTTPAYHAAVIYNMLKLPSYNIELIIHAQQDCASSHAQAKTTSHVREHIVLGALCNGSFYGNGFHPAPAAQVDDGYAELVLGTKMSRLTFAKLAPRYKAGTHLNHPHVRAFSKVVSGSVIAHTRHPIEAEFDGTLLAFHELEFKITPRALNFAYL